MVLLTISSTCAKTRLLHCKGPVTSLILIPLIVRIIFYHWWAVSLSLSWCSFHLSDSSFLWVWRLWVLRFTPILFPLTSFLGQPTASHCLFGCDDLLHPHFSFGCVNLYHTCVFLCFGYAYLCPAVPMAAYSFSSSYLLFCTLPQRGYTDYSI